MTAGNTSIADSKSIANKVLDTWILFEGIMRSTMMSGALTHREFVICNTVADAKEPITATTLCEKLAMHKSQMNRTLQKLENGGMIIRERSKTDKRNVYIRLNPSGCAEFRKMREQAIVYTDMVIDTLGKERIGQIKKSFDDVICALNKVTMPSGKEQNGKQG